MDIELTILGSGTSTGVPMLNCQCETCTSSDPRDNRYRSSARLRWGGTTVVIDTPPEFRLQMLRTNTCTVDAVLITHNHADHINGLDDLRQFTFCQETRIPVYGKPETMDWIEAHYEYIWAPLQLGGGVPKIDLCPVCEAFELDGVLVTPIPVKHGIMTIYGYRIGNLAYISDVSAIPEESMLLLEGVEVLFLDAVRYRQHATHFHLAAAIEVAQAIGAEQTYFTHLNHDFLHRRLAAELPRGMAPAFDGLVVHGRG
jgi:phosphoribosyl 1,2-cyclic phosphate phosphodiesterase